MMEADDADLFDMKNSKLFCCKYITCSTYKMYFIISEFFWSKDF